MKKIFYTLKLLLAGLFFATMLANCALSTGTDSGSGSTTTSHQYLTIPNAVFVSGTPSGAQGNSGVTPTVTAPTNTTYTVDTTVTWSVDFSAVLEVTEVDYLIIEVTELDGYFVYPLTDEEIATGSVEIDTELVNEEPSSGQVCNRDYRGNGTCYGEADSGVTGMDFAAANLDEAQETFSWTAYVEVSVTIEWVEEDSSDSDDSGSGYSSSTVCSDWVTYCSCNLRACSDGTQAWYDVGSGVYYCASTSNCTSAAQQAVSWCTQGC